jgi:hypothetical protein
MNKSIHSNTLQQKTSRDRPHRVDLHATRYVRSVTASLAILSVVAASSAHPIASSPCRRATPGSSDLTPAQLRLLIEAARSRLPSFAVRYTLGSGPVALADEWEYAVFAAAVPETSVRLTAWTSAPDEARDPNDAPLDPDVVSWGFDASTSRAYVLDEVGQSMRLARAGGLVGLGGISSEYEQCSGIAPLHCAAFGERARVDLLRMLAEPATVVRPGEAECGGYSCIVIESPLGGGTLVEPGSALDHRLRTWVAPQLGYAQVASETIIGGTMRQRRSASEFHQVADGATWLPLFAVVENTSPDSPSRVELRVLREADGRPAIALGEGVVVTRAPGVGTEVRDLDTGEVRITTAGWEQQANRILAAHDGAGGGNAINRGGGAAMAAVVPLISLLAGFGLARVRRPAIPRGHRA